MPSVTTRIFAPRLAATRALLALGLLLSIGLGAAAELRANPSEAIRERWSFVLQHLTNDNVDAAALLIADLQRLQRENGIRNLFVEAELVHALGMRALARGEPASARDAFRLAQDLAPDLPEPWFEAGLLEIADVSVEGAVARGGLLLLEGGRALLGNPERLLRVSANGVFGLLLVLLATATLLALFLLLRHARLATQVLATRTGGRIPQVAWLIALAHLLLLPFLLAGSLLLSVALVLAAGTRAERAAERRWSWLTLLALGIVPVLVMGLRLVLVLPDDPAVRLFRCEVGTCEPAALDKLEEEEGVPLDWLLKVRGDYHSRSYRGDPFIFETARGSYAAALKLNQQDPALWVSFGNLLLAAFRYAPATAGEDALGQAMLLYDRALAALGEDAGALYNKSRVLDLQGNGDGSDAYMRRALEANQALIVAKEEVRQAGLGGSGTRPFNHNVDLFPRTSPPSRVLLALAFGASERAARVGNRVLGTLGEAGFAGAWLALIALCALVGVLRRGRAHAHHCPSCGDVVVPPRGATEEERPPETCTACYYQSVKGRFMEPRELVLFEIRQRRRQARLYAGAALLNVVVPGAGLLARGRVGAGLFVFATLLALALAVAQGPIWLAEPRLWQAGGQSLGRWVLVGLAGVIYLIAQILVLRRPAKRHGAIRTTDAGKPDDLGKPPPLPSEAPTAPLRSADADIADRFLEGL